MTKKLCFYSRHRQEIYLVSITSRLAMGYIQPPTHSYPEVLSLVVKWQKREANCLPPSSSKLKNEWSYTSLDPYAFVVRTGAILSIYVLLLTFEVSRLLHVPLGITLKNSTWFSHCVCVFCTDLRTNSDSCLTQH